jgi:16S rRNA (cytosine1402-N4)-methyltransferase
MGPGSDSSPVDPALPVPAVPAATGPADTAGSDDIAGSDASDDIARPAAGLDDIHVPVLLGRISDLFAPAFPADRPATLVDATLGMGGHTLALLRRYPMLRVIGLDRDTDALAIAGRRLADAGLADRADLVHTANDEIGAVVDRLAPAGVQGILFDLGVSSLQLDETDRGFAYSVDAPLDMRMDRSRGMTAAEVLNSYPARELTRVLREYGEERFASRIAAAIVRQRADRPFVTSAPLVALIRDNIPAATRRTGGHPAKRTFQALRVEVNDELGVLRRAVPEAVRSLAVDGRLVVMSFQSLEDRIVKRVLDPQTRSSAPEGLPFPLPEHEPTLRWLTRGSVTPDEQEIAENPRAASARLRAVQRIRKAAA